MRLLADLSRFANQPRLRIRRLVSTSEKNACALKKCLRNKNNLKYWGREKGAWVNHQV